MAQKHERVGGPMPVNSEYGLSLHRKQGMEMKKNLKLKYRSKTIMSLNLAIGIRSYFCVDGDKVAKL